MPTEADIELAKRLAHEIGMQSEGTKDAERVRIREMAGLIEKLLDGTATDADRQRGQEILPPSAQH